MSKLLLNDGIFPAWRHHKNGVDSVVVNSKEECEALGDDWADCPAAFDVKQSVEVLKPVPSIPIEAPAHNMVALPGKVDEPIQKPKGWPKGKKRKL